MSLLAFAVLFVAAEMLDLSTYLRAPELERNVAFIASSLLGVWIVAIVKMACVGAILLGGARLAWVGRTDAPVLTWAKAVFLVGAGVGFASALFNMASLGLL